MSTIDDPREFFLTVQEARTTYLLYGWSGVFGILFSLPDLFAFYKAIVRQAPMVQLALFFVLIGSTLALVGVFKPLTLVYEYVPMALAASPETLSLWKNAATAAADVMQLPWNIGSF